MRTQPLNWSARHVCSTRSRRSSNLLGLNPCRLCWPLMHQATAPRQWMEARYPYLDPAGQVMTVPVPWIIMMLPVQIYPWSREARFVHPMAVTERDRISMMRLQALRASAAAAAAAAAAAEGRGRLQPLVRPCRGSTIFSGVSLDDNIGPLQM